MQPLLHRPRHAHHPRGLRPAGKPPGRADRAADPLGRRPVVGNGPHHQRPGRALRGRPGAPRGRREAAGACPLLAGDLCPVYALRPFNCRCFVSRAACAEQGYAEVDEATVAVNTLFLQTIEHIDAGGCTGYLPDVVAALADPEHAQAYREGTLGCAACGLAPNRPLRVLMVPPELRARIDPLVARLREIRV